MKFDTVIIGGGLSGLICGIRLAEQGQSCATVSSGQSALHFFSGSFGLLSSIDGAEVENPVEAAASLPGEHPYQRIGKAKMVSLAANVPELFKNAGITLHGSADRNHYVLTSMGTMKPAWLTLDDFTAFPKKDDFSWKKAAIVNFTGFFDFHTVFTKDGLQQLGIEAEIKEIAMGRFEAIRRNPSEMRTSNIARVFDNGELLDEFTAKVNELGHKADVVVLPAVFGLSEGGVVTQLKARIKKPVVLLPVLPPSTPGIRVQMSLRRYFQELGGTYLSGDTVVNGIFEEDKLLYVHTSNHGDIRLEADNFVLATGSYYSKGIVASPDSLFEPIFGLDIDGNTDRSQWFDQQIFNDQPFMRFGVKTDDQFRAVMGGKVIKNLYAAGSILAGANPLKEHSGAGICMLTSLYIAEQILG